MLTLRQWLEPMGAAGAESGESFRKRLHHILESKETEYVLLALLIADIIAVIASGFLEIAYLESKFEDSEEINIACVQGRRRRGCALPDHYGNETLHDVEVILIYVSVVILGLFIIEHVLHMVATSFMAFFSEWRNVLDLLVVVVSMAFEVAALLHMNIAASAGAIALMRLWRFARIIHGTAEARDIAEEAEEQDESGDRKEHADPEGANTIGNTAD